MPKLKEVVISTSDLNCYGSRILTEGIDLTQYEKNPILLWMHRRCYEDASLPIGRMENLRVEGDRLIGTPVFDMDDLFARQIANKWEKGFLRMASAGVEIIETSTEEAMLLPGQRRATITKCKLEEVSIVDIGGNDAALQLYGGDGRRLELSSGEACEVLPLIGEEPAMEEEEEEENGSTLVEEDNNPNNFFRMNEQVLKLLGLSSDASEQEVEEAVLQLVKKASEVDALRLTGIEAVVDEAIAGRRITGDMREHFIGLGKSVGVESLRKTLELMRPERKPTEWIVPQGGVQSVGVSQWMKLSDVPDESIEGLKAERPSEYARLYKAEYGVDLKN